MHSSTRDVLTTTSGGCNHLLCEVLIHSTYRYQMIHLLLLSNAFTPLIYDSLVEQMFIEATVRDTDSRSFLEYDAFWYPTFVAFGDRIQKHEFLCASPGQIHFLHRPPCFQCQLICGYPSVKVDATFAALPLPLYILVVLFTEVPLSPLLQPPNVSSMFETTSTLLPHTHTFTFIASAF